MCRNRKSHIWDICEVPFVSCDNFALNVIHMNERVKSHPLTCTLLLCFEDEEDDVEEPEEVEDEDAEVSAKFKLFAFSQESSAVSLSLG